MQLLTGTPSRGDGGMLSLPRSEEPPARPGEGGTPGDVPQTGPGWARLRREEPGRGGGLRGGSFEGAEEEGGPWRKTGPQRQVPPEEGWSPAHS